MSKLPIVPKLEAFDKKLKEVQREIRKEKVVASVVGDAVQIVGNANFEVKEVKIDPSFLKNLDEEAMTEFIGSAIKQFIKKAQKINGKIISHDFGWFGEFLTSTLVDEEEEE